MRCVTNCGVALPVIGLLSAVAVFAAQSTATTGSNLPATGGMVVASTRLTDTTEAIMPTKADLPAAVNMNDWQETNTRRRGSSRRL